MNNFCKDSFIDIKKLVCVEIGKVRCISICFLVFGFNFILFIEIVVLMWMDNNLIVSMK